MEIKVDGIDISGFKKAKSYGCKRTTYKDERDEEGKITKAFEDKENLFEFYNTEDCKWQEADYWGGYSRGYSKVPLPKDDVTPIEYVDRIDFNIVVIKHGKGKKQHYRVLFAKEGGHQYHLSWGSYWNRTPSEEEKKWRGTTPIVFMSEAYQLVGKNKDDKWVFITDVKKHNEKADEWTKKLAMSVFDKDQETLPYERDLLVLDEYYKKLESFIEESSEIKFEKNHGFDEYNFRNLKYTHRGKVKGCENDIARINHEKQMLVWYKNGEITKTDAIRNFSNWNDYKLKREMEGESK